MNVYDPYERRSLYTYNFDDEDLQQDFERHMKKFSMIFSQDIPIDQNISWAYAKGITNQRSNTYKILDASLDIFTDSSTWTWYGMGDDHRGHVADKILKDAGGNIQKLVKYLEIFLRMWRDPEEAKYSYNIVYYAYMDRL